MGRRLLVTGAGRSGTRAVARHYGLSHEKAFTSIHHGEGDWQREVSWLAAPFTPLADTYVIHLVRDPRLAIRSRAFEWSADSPNLLTRAHWAFAAHYVPGMWSADSALEAAALYWVAWNRLVVADTLWRLEDLAIPPVGVHTEEWPDLDWDDIDVPGLRDLAKGYGYP